MTDEQNAALDRVFQRYGRPSDEWNDTIHIYHRHPSKFESCKEIRSFDRSISDDIKRLEAALDGLKAYQVAVAERYAELATAPTVPVVKLIRRRYGRYGVDAGKVFYDLKTCDRNLNENLDVETSSTTFPGTERRKAIAAYHAYVKSHPGIIAEMDIEKPKWER